MPENTIKKPAAKSAAGFQSSSSKLINVRRSSHPLIHPLINFIHITRLLAIFGFDNQGGTACKCIDIPDMDLIFDHPGDKSQSGALPCDRITSDNLLDFPESNVCFRRESLHVSFALRRGFLFRAEYG